ncbi:MAG: efflux RND transporter periplasmic adaptor subunit [Dyadobacter sp.]|uniref:efflux RND transporter periplasmic adaptor subunit n=1 Tax=Dyadobacter sp. TaxID=1914288 RepID=UPI001AFD7AAD|nr:efflux RND transporter periplasmic adaptor subunit [Dyadobacter sp.]MBO9611175.1 efflux RND transporter periplasmic adaptor subunit [Dyadobacter sp.]
MTQGFMLSREKTKQALLIGLVAWVSACGPKQEQPPMQNAPVSVDFQEIRQSEAQVEKKYPGSIEGSVNVDIKAQVSGYLDEIYVREGEYVQKGKPLFRIKGDVFQEQVNNADAALKAALAAEESVRIELEKMRPLVQGKVMSPVQLQTVESNYASAKAQVAQAKAALGSSQINAAFSLIKAPVSGYIGRIPNRIGNLVTPADAAPLTTLSEINDVFVYFSLSESDFISFMKDRQTDEGLHTVELIMADGTTYPQKGRVEIASGNIERATGSIPLKAVFPNPDKVLRSGGTGKVVLRRTLTDALTVPLASVKDIQDRYFVFALGDSNKVAMRPIEVSGRAKNHYIVKSGLKEGDRIALNRIDVLTEGMPVEPGKTGVADAAGK